MFKMIYKELSLSDDLQQGDIFTELPFSYFDLDALFVYTDDSTFGEISWKDLTKEDIQILADIEKVYAIILSQDCDCLREEYISLIVVSEWKKDYKKSNKWREEIIKLNRSRPSKMYLPPDSNFNINKKMHIDFSQIFNLKRENLINLKNLRLCRLNEEAMDHFREKLAFYFHRYAFDEFYPLDKEEMDSYEKWRKEAYERRNYQR
ncbi:hypothetical protein LCGC14_0543410 [marine sediment metagenome]|uniref:Uncharacterized protein n=1 Tax=marine sediment metagenome TaxID=412755 RepID=A0A0F9RSA5_9ZZZZ|nr:MAG: hypothetical protein Lokiarch_36170 [Candidatus Lokiarchaeum sp. GC14_75]